MSSCASSALARPGCSSPLTCWLAALMCSRCALLPGHRFQGFHSVKSSLVVLPDASTPRTHHLCGVQSASAVSLSEALLQVHHACACRSSCSVNSLTHVAFVLTSVVGVQVSLVINYDLPTQPENYLHRIGRSGRFGRKGVAINFVTKEDERILQDVQRFYNTVIEELPANVADLI